ncbi:efflux RND transporter permease subunit [Ahrensia kielensis]|uniref:Efflux RND transporter permease subunit n=1 Tax=Ahrensia kielensis TaxID=76980 RepID=A0ABU9T2B4_9HYPH
MSDVSSEPKKKSISGLTGTFVARPILALVLNLLIIIAGLAALNSVDVREMPDVDRPVLSVRTTYTGASAKTVDQEVTKVLEDALGGLDGLSYISSTSQNGSSRITIDLSDGTDVNVAANEAREIVSQTTRQLPDDIDDPAVRKSDTNSDPIVRLAVVGNASIPELTEIAEGTIYDRLSLIDGIAEVTVTGSQALEFRVTLNMPSLLSRGLSIFDVSTALKSLRDDTPLGSIETASQELTLRSSTPEVTEQMVNDVLINASTRLSDIAFVQLVAEDNAASSRLNGNTAIGIDIVRQSVGNTLTISKNVRAAVAELQSELPDGIELTVTSDDGIFIEGSINEVTTSIMIATGIVIAVIFLFLRSWRATIIPAVTIPVALIGTIAAIWITGFSVNTISLLALVLATGMVVDDAIVVVENIVRKRSEGMGAFAAAVAGTNEVFFAVISTTATLAAVFIPISFLPGQAGGIFSEFGFVLAFSVTLSSIAALTLAPMMASVLDPGKSNASETNEESRKPSFMLRTFDTVMDKAIKAPFLVIAIAAAFVIFSAGAMSNLSSEVTPSEDRAFFLIPARGATGATLEYVENQVEQIEAILQPYVDKGEVKIVQTLLGRGGGSSAFIIVRLADWAERERSQQEILVQLNRELAQVPGLTVSARSGNSLGIRGAGRGVQFAVTGNNLELLSDAASEMVAAMRQDETFANPQLSADNVEPLLELSVDGDLVKDLGLSPQLVSSTINAMLQGEVATSVFVDDTEVDIRLVPGGPPLDNPSDVESIFVQTADKVYVPVSAMAKLEQVVSASQIVREGGSLSVSLQANLGDGIDLGTAAARVSEVAQEILPDGASIVFLGEAAELESSQSGLYLIFGVAFTVVFLVLAAQFESFASAFVIMLTVPFGLAAALLAISLSGGTLNYYSQIGLVMLIGVMAKNGILIVEFANQLREQGQDIDSAIRNALHLRIRPVMMTMVSTVFGGLPLILTSGAGAEARIAVGSVIVGGLGFATIFTLFLTPVFYRLIAGWGAAPGASQRRLENEIKLVEAEV